LKQKSRKIIPFKQIQQKKLHKKRKEIKVVKVSRIFKRIIKKEGKIKKN